MKRAYYLASLIFTLLTGGAQGQQWILPGEGYFGGISALGISQQDLIGAQLTDLRLGGSVGYRFGSRWDIGWHFYWQSEDAYKEFFPGSTLTRDEWILLDNRRMISGPIAHFTDSLTLAGYPLTYTVGLQLYRGWSLAEDASTRNGDFDLTGGEAGFWLSREVSLGKDRFAFTPGFGAFATLNQLTDTGVYGLEDMAENRRIYDGTSAGFDLLFPLHFRLGTEYPVRMTLVTGLRYTVVSDEGAQLHLRFSSISFNF